VESGIFVINGSDTAPRLVFLSKNQTTAGAVMKAKASFHALVALTLIPGVFAGCSKTPARTDAQIVSDVQGKFYTDPAVESRQIQVQAAGGVVTLSGNVASDSERAAAASDAALVAGVRIVVNNLQVQQALLAPPRAEAVQPPARTKRPQRENANRAASQQSQEPDTAGSAMEASNTPPPESPPAAQAPPPAPLPPAPPQKVIVPAGTQLTVAQRSTRFRT
jgi:BON domain